MLYQACKKVGKCEDWTDLLDHGGLCHVKETFQFLCSLEEKSRKLLPTLDSMTPFKAMVMEKLSFSEYIQFYWCMTTTVFDIQDIHLGG